MAIPSPSEKFGEKHAGAKSTRRLGMSIHYEKRKKDRLIDSLSEWVCVYVCACCACVRCVYVCVCVCERERESEGCSKKKDKLK